MARKYSYGRVVWITGLSGAGKTTLAKALILQLGPGIILLDGDEMREVLGVTHSGFDPESRRCIAFIYARMARLLAMQGFTVVVATISLFNDLHSWNRDNLPGYCEVWLDVPEEERRTRDPKGLYAASAGGQIQSMACDGMVEVPLAPHLTLRFGDHADLDTHVKALLAALNENEDPAASWPCTVGV